MYRQSTNSPPPPATHTEAVLSVQDGLTKGWPERTRWCWASNIEPTEVLAWALAVPRMEEKEEKRADSQGSTQ